MLDSISFMFPVYLPQQIHPVFFFFCQDIMLYVCSPLLLLSFSLWCSFCHLCQILCKYINILFRLWRVILFFLVLNLIFSSLIAIKALWMFQFLFFFFFGLFSSAASFVDTLSLLVFKMWCIMHVLCIGLGWEE